MHDTTRRPATSVDLLPDTTSRPKWQGGRYLSTILLALTALIPLLTIEKKHGQGGRAVAAPTFSPPQGYYSRDVRVRLSVSDPELDILYTLDGRVPTKDSGSTYAKPLHLRASSPAVTVIRARAVLADGELGPVANVCYVVGVQTELPILSLTVDPADFWGSERGIYANPEGRGRPWERPVDVVYLEAADARGARHIGFHVPAGLRIHGGTTRVNAEKKSLRLYFRDEYGFNRLEYPLFASDEAINAGIPRPSSFKRLVVHSGGQDFSARNWTLMRIPLMNSLAEPTKSYTTLSRPVLLYLNGRCEGIYHLRTYVDDWLLADQYGIKEADLLDAPFAPTYAGVPLVALDPIPPLSEFSREEQAGVIWERMIRFLQTADLSQPENYAYVQTQIEIDNFVDYHILQIYASNNDWLHHNVKQFRPRTHGGRWNWILWDVDWSFGKAWQSSYEFNMIDWLYTCERENFDRGSLPLRKLLENPEFRALFISRTADLLNTVLRPEVVVGEIDRLADGLRADMPYEVDRWPHEGSWEDHVDYLREFARRRPDALRQNMVDGFGLDATQALTVNPPSAGEGSVAVNGTLVPAPWRGIYFGGTTVDLVAAPEPGYRFAGWEPKGLPQEPHLTIELSSSRSLAPRFAPDQQSPQPGDLLITAVRLDDTDGAIEGDWLELLVARPGGLDLRNWRITDNDTKMARDEGSLIFREQDGLARVPHGTSILIAATRTSANDVLFTEDRLPPWYGGQMVLYVGNDHLDTTTDPGFVLGVRDNVAVLAPGESAGFEDDLGIAFATTDSSTQPRGLCPVTPASFGILSDGVTTGMPRVVP